jgi:Ser/Thr protein kinase RdoA (MazF antagonist)
VFSLSELPEAERIERYERLARKALAVYALEDSDLRFMGWTSNIVFRVQTDDGRWALRICPPDTDHNAIMRELLWLVAIGRDTRLSVPEPVIMRSGELFRSVSMPGISGFHPCMLFRWVKGQFADEITAQHLRAVGHVTATLHQHARSFRWPEEIALPSAPLISIAESLSETATRHASSEDLETLQEAVSAIRRVTRSLGDEPSVFGTIHGDLQRGNILFHEGEARPIDFECVQTNFYGYDIAATLRELMPRANLEELKNAYFEGYSAVRPLPCNPDEHLPAFFAMHELARMVRSLREAPHEIGTPSSDALHSAAGKVRQLLDLQ